MRRPTAEGGRVHKRLLIPLVVPVLVLAGCGGGSKKSASNGVEAKSANDIVAAAKAAADAATAVHVTGSGTDSGMRLVLDLHIVAGKGGKGRLAEQGLSFDLIRIGDTAYIKGSPAFYRKFAGPAAAALFKGKWLKASATTGDLASLTPLTDLRKLLDRTLANPGTLAKLPTTTVRGQSVVGVKDTSKGGILYVATAGKPYPVQITKSGASGGSLTFDQWDQPIALTAPANAVDISKLKG
jgi:hypothetical protein